MVFPTSLGGPTRALFSDLLMPRPKTTFGASKRISSTLWGRVGEVLGERVLMKIVAIVHLRSPVWRERNTIGWILRCARSCDGFAAGFNYYLARHPEVQPRLLTRIEPWYTLAFIRYNYYQNGFSRDNNLGCDLSHGRNPDELQAERWVPTVGLSGPARVRAGTPCSSSIRTCLSSVQVRFTRDTSTATKDGISLATPVSVFRFLTLDITRTAAGSALTMRPTLRMFISRPLMIPSGPCVQVWNRLPVGDRTSGRDSG